MTRSIHNRLVRATLAIGTTLLVAVVFGPVPAGSARAQDKAKSVYRLAEVRVNRAYGFFGPDKQDKGPEKKNEVFKGNPGKIELLASRAWYTNKLTLTIEAPEVVQDGQEVTLKSTAESTMDFKLKEPSPTLGFDVSTAFRYQKGDLKSLVGTAAKPITSGQHSITATTSHSVKVTGGDATFGGYTADERGFFVNCQSSIIGNQGLIEVWFVYRREVGGTKPPDPKLPDPKQPHPTPTGDCPKTLAGQWQGPVSGVFTYQVNGTSVTGSVANLGGKHGPATITGTLNGTTMTGTWKSASASGKITHTGPNAACITQMTYTVENPPGPGGSENTLPPSGPGGSGGHAGRPWETAEGRDCFEKWIALATKLLNDFDGGAEHNGRKPWSFNKYGLREGKGITSAFAPDDFARHDNNKYWWMWDYYDTDSLGQFIREPFLNKAGVPPLRDYVRRCSPTSGSQSLPDGMILVAPDVIVPRGTQVMVPVRLLNARDVLNMDFQLSYLPEVASARAEAEKGSAVSEIWEYKLNRPGLFKFNFASLTPFNGNGTVGGFRFDATGPGRSRTPLSLYVHTVNDSKGVRLPITTINGSITIYDPTDLADPNNPKNPNPPGGSGGVRSQPTCSGTGRQTVADAQCCLKMWVGLTGRSLHMDINNDGEVDSRDAVLVLQNVAQELSR